MTNEEYVSYAVLIERYYRLDTELRTPGLNAPLPFMSDDFDAPMEQACEFCGRTVSACDADISFGCGTTQAGESQAEKRARVEREKAQTWRDKPAML